MKRDEILRRFPYASESTIQANLDQTERLRAPKPERVEGSALERAAKGKAPRPGLPAPDPRMRVCFRVWSMRPLDWDNYWFKPLQDCLVNAGLLRGDAWDQLEGRVEVFKAGKASEERTEILIEPS